MKNSALKIILQFIFRLDLPTDQHSKRLPLKRDRRTMILPAALWVVAPVLLRRRRRAPESCSWRTQAVFN